MAARPSVCHSSPVRSSLSTKPTAPPPPLGQWICRPALPRQLGATLLQLAAQTGAIVLSPSAESSTSISQTVAYPEPGASLINTIWGYSRIARGQFHRAEGQEFQEAFPPRTSLV